jgi:hypothetical protein
MTTKVLWFSVGFSVGALVLSYLWRFWLGKQILTVKQQLEGTSEDIKQVKVLDMKLLNQEVLDHAAKTRAVLVELVECKDLHDAGKTVEYKQRKEAAWAEARKILAVRADGPTN